MSAASTPSSAGPAISRARERRLIRQAVLILAVIVAVPACGDDAQPANTSTVGIANPASEFCIANGGHVDIVNDGGGQLGYCNLPDGTRIEEWEYYRSHTGATTSP
jgi:uncharacterized protein